MVSWPAMSIVIRSSRSCLSLGSASRRSTRNRSRLGSDTCVILRVMIRVKIGVEVRVRVKVRVRIRVLQG